MTASADTAPNGFQPNRGPKFQVLGTGDGNDGAFATGIVLIDPASGSPYAATAGNASSTVALHDTTTPSRGATVSAAGALKVDGSAVTQPVESNHYGTPSAGASVTVGITSTSVLGANASRKFLALGNDSANTIYVDLSGGAAVASKGVRLNANGGALILDRYVPTSAITAIASAASSVLTIQEG